MSCEIVYGSFKGKISCKKMDTTALAFKENAGRDVCLAYDAFEEYNSTRKKLKAVNIVQDKTKRKG